MGCCGQKRAALKHDRQQTAEHASASARRREATPLNPAPTMPSQPWQAPPPSTGPIWVHCTRDGPLRVVGAVTGISYEFSAARRRSLVDPRDAAVLLRTGPFQRD
jgi:hypothetical protein